MNPSAPSPALHAAAVEPGATQPAVAPGGSRVFPRQFGARLPRVASGRGLYLTDTEGREYLDACGGAAVSCLGHGDAAVNAAIARQLDEVAYAHTAFFTSAAAEELAELLIEQAPKGLTRVYYTGSGSEAMEAAVKLTRQVFVARGLPSKTRFIARHQSYHGATLGVLPLGGVAWRRQLYAPLTMSCSFIPPCYAYRHRGPDESLEDYGRRAADALEAEILRLGPDSVAAFVAETVVGATAGVVPAAPGYFRRIREICDRYDVLLILDEVMCGMGRTGAPFACLQDGVAPDLLCVAKGLAAGYQPLAAMLVAEHLADTIAATGGVFHHGQTYMGHPTACAAALAVQRKIRMENLLDNVVEQGAALLDLLDRRLGTHPHVGDIRGRGLFTGIELVADRATKAPFDPAQKLHARVKRAAMARGLLCYPGGGGADGRAGNHILLAVPFIARRPDIVRIVDRLAPAIDDAIAEL